MKKQASTPPGNEPDPSVDTGETEDTPSQVKESDLSADEAPEKDESTAQTAVAQPVRSANAPLFPPTSPGPRAPRPSTEELNARHQAIVTERDRVARTRVPKGEEWIRLNGKKARLISTEKTPQGDKYTVILSGDKEKRVFMCPPAVIEAES